MQEITNSGKRMKVAFSLVFFFFFCFFINDVSCVKAQETNFQKKLLPKQVLLQFAGNIGFISVGLSYGGENNFYMRDYFWGYVPYSIGKTEIHSLSFKNKLRIKKLKNGIIYGGVALSFETGRNSQLELPSCYPEAYYGTDSFYFPVFLGISQHFNNFPRYLSGLFYYVEVGTITDYLYYNFLKKEFFNTEIFSLALGIRYSL